MAATTRSRVVELSQHSAGQIISYYVLAALSAVVLFLFVAAPALDSFFADFLRSEVIRDGTAVSYSISDNRKEELVTTNPLATWALVDPASTHDRPPRIRNENGVVIAEPEYHAEYIFRPLIALAPFILVGGFLIATLLTSLLPSSAGYLAQKIEREVLVALDRLAFAQYGEHTPQEISQLTREITKADTRRLHDLGDIYGLPFTDLELLQKALQWMESKGLNRALRTHDAIKFYMREYFTDRYSNTILGLVYMGAAVLIIVIGIRGLKFLPSTDPSVVLGALGLEFMLLVTYAAVLMYGRSEESGGMHKLAPADGMNDLETDGDTEKLLRAFLAVPRSNDREKS